jgi:hypothetical protein
MHGGVTQKMLLSVQDNTRRKVPGKRRNLRIQCLPSAAALHASRNVFMAPALLLGVMHVLLHHYNSELVYLALRPHQLT